MNTFPLTRLTRTDARYGFQNRSESTLLPAVCIATGSRVVTFGATRGRQGTHSCENIGQPGVDFVKRSFLHTACISMDFTVFLVSPHRCTPLNPPICCDFFSKYFLCKCPVLTALPLEVMMAPISSKSVRDPDINTGKLSLLPHVRNLPNQDSDSH